MSVQVNSLISYVQRVKPFHTKILGVEVSYVVADSINVEFIETLNIEMNLGIPASYYLPSGSMWDANEYDASGFDGSRIKPNNNTYAPTDLINVPDHAKWDGLAYDISEWDPFFDPAYDLRNGIYPSIDGVGTGMIDGIHVSFEEKLHMDVHFSDVNIPKPVYVEIPDTWDNDKLSILNSGLNWIEVAGDRVQTFTSQPLLVFQITGGDLNGTYTCTSASITVPGVTRIYTAETTPSLSGNVFGSVDVGYWDDQGWDQTVFATLPNGHATFPAGASIFEMFSISEGIGWDQGAWDNTDGTYTGTTDQQYHHPDFWTLPDLWDDAINIVDGHNIYTPSAIPINATTVSNVDLAYTWDTSEFDLHGFNGNENVTDGANFGVLNTYTELSGTHKRVIFGSSIGVTSGRMVEVHIQDVPSQTWTFSDPLQGIGSFIVYDEFGTQIQWSTCSISAGHTVTIEFPAPTRGYVLGE